MNQASALKAVCTGVLGCVLGSVVAGLASSLVLIVVVLALHAVA